MATILIVDDDALIVDMLVEVIEDAGHTAIASTNGPHAWLLAQEYHPDMVITDVMMPRINGYELLAALRSDPTMGDTPVILISAGFGPEEFKPGPDITSVSKPLDLRLIESLLPL